MPQFMYLFPGLEGRPDDEFLTRRGLGHLCGTQMNTQRVYKGPAGVEGTIVMPHGAPASQRLGYYPNEQKWQKAAAPGGEYWLAWPTASAPGPADLARRDQVQGHDVTLADDRLWKVPIAISIHAGTPLPRRFVLNEDGSLTVPVMSEYEKLSEVAANLYADKHAIFAGGGALAYDTYEKQFTTAATVLAMNYRVGFFEVAALGLIDQRNILQVFDAVIDWPTAVALAGAPVEAVSEQKKNTPAG
jgi:hypothetical protein